MNDDLNDGTWDTIWQATQIWVHIVSGDGLFLDGTKLLPEPIWLIIQGFLWHSPESDFKRNIHKHNP